MTADRWSDGVADAVIPQVIDVDGVPMSGLLAEAADPRCVIVAIHGGATRAGYFDYPGHPANSLLRSASAAGYTVLALDRPGYGSSADHAETMHRPERRVDLAYGAIAGHLSGRPTGAGVFVWSHSIGCELAVRLAADDRGDRLLGLELAGTGLQHQPVAHEILGESERNAAPVGVRKLLWQPPSLYPSDVIGGTAIASSTPSFEGRAVRTWPGEVFPALAPEVRIPVHFTAGAHERVWRQDPQALSDIAALFTGAPRVAVDVMPGSGHNLSLGHSARAYHFRILSFLEQCLVARIHPDLPAL
ncbi:alpha/beta hydrolase [Gordonia rhizosphera]|uniref:AB hydrolase-1 domain-containing protein n=1 Tax=Gordonia rhizosphera NBRC 16068 TaxID=1108045 RepID=K6WBT6_9ACTN|nr:alpha/beta hydrolase [Gordonia rhizosphera]GAB89657.1 hypothetical protein GORHZ_069_00360 [Gordonia rhizosphera NBRC 16068]